ncbi:1219_t:CDS:2 [Dentiscutata heterogama]|uniref:1219_t:CDS:1 n=1 Tax=Dentiscutata heterogama TaxID=1316150 RepID=A0ACA9NET8_9GLOM|nr:1219_t:CDS:2 [Dentiscutata heterogama]
MLLHYRERYTKSLHSNLEKIGSSMRVDAGEVERFWQGEGKPPTKSQLQCEKEKIIRKGKLLYKKNQFDLSDDIQDAVVELEDKIDIIRKESLVLEVDKFESQKIKTPEMIDDYFIKQRRKLLCITRKSKKFACSCSYNIIHSHDCQNIVAVRFFINKLETRKSVPKSTSNSSLESYLRQKDASGHSKDELKLP